MKSVVNRNFDQKSYHQSEIMQKNDNSTFQVVQIVINNENIVRMTDVMPVFMDVFDTLPSAFIQWSTWRHRDLFASSG